MFHVRRRPADYHPRKRKKKPQHKWSQHPSGSNELLEYRYEDGLDRLPLLLELNPGTCEDFIIVLNVLKNCIRNIYILGELSNDEIELSRC